jgi:hypothetical protein
MLLMQAHGNPRPAVNAGENSKSNLLNSSRQKKTQQCTATLTTATAACAAVSKAWYQAAAATCTSAVLQCGLALLLAQ